MAWLNAWTPFFQAQTRVQGRACSQEGRLQRVEPSGDELARFEVEDEGNRYEVTVAPDSAGAVLSCDCERFATGVYCSHIWAALGELQQNPTGSENQFPDLGELRPRPPKARKRKAAVQRRQQADPPWLQTLSLLRMSQAELDEAAALLPVQRQVCYIIDVDSSARRQSLVIELRQRQPTATGWGKPRALKINNAVVGELTEPEDRELCALILGATWVSDDEAESLMRYESDRGRSRFRLHSGAWRLMMYRMLATERCFLELGDELLPLAWDAGHPAGNADLTADTWTLWLFGMDGPTDLDLSLELRRRGRRVPVDRPRLLLGGPDGLVILDHLVAPFDDHGAIRWLAHLRDLQSEAGNGALRVPKVDIDRFLDRLYTLPQLPEIDLPEGYGKQEQLLKPQPIIDIFSPDHAARDTSGARGQLTATVTFQYGSAVVNPADTNRFVTSQPAPPTTEADAGPPLEIPPPGALPDPAAEVAQTDVAQAEVVEAEGAEAETAGEPGVITPATGEQILIRRDRALERNALGWLLTIGFRQAPGSGQSLTLSPRQLPQVVSALLARNWRVRADERLIRQPGPPRLSVTSGIDWFELRGSVRFTTDAGEVEVDLPRLLAAARAGRNLIDLGDGTQGLLPQQWLEEHGLLTTIGDLEDDHLRFRPSQAALLDTLLRRQEQVAIDEGFEQVRQRLLRFDGIKPLTPAPSFRGSLRAYQQEALGWFDFLRHFGMGGILADDMGLGKTVQVLALLDSWYQASGTEARAPSLIVAPRSVVFNWVDEAHRFAPDLRVQVYSGTERETLRKQFAEQHLIVTSYGLMRRDITELQQFAFDYVALDEAQAIKNPGSQSAKAARLLNATYRLALTGTPVENHLGDLWSIFEFLNPGMLGASTRFSTLVRSPHTGATRTSVTPVSNTTSGLAVKDVDAPRAAQVAQQVATALRPFVLRRTKAQVLKDLPEKTEQTIVCEMEPAQRRLYDELREYYRHALLGRSGAPGSPGAPGGGGGGNAIMVLEALLRLRQAACHPGLIDAARAGEESAKLEALTDALVELIEEGHKALVFSQFVEMLTLVRKRLDELGIVYEYLDGQTRDRKRRVDHFQADPDCPVFLISLKAGGLGLNLTAAEYVFILDPWWNPAVEQQAIDRTHRIGQTRHVFAYRLICKDTVEQRIAELQEKKRRLADAIVGGQENLLSSLTRDELEQLLS